MALYDVSTSEKKANPALVAGGTLYADSPIGTILPYGGASAPSGWFLCQGQALSRTTYSELFAVIGTSFGVGNGSTTFNLPDMRESVPKGAGLTGLSSNHMDSDGLALGEFIDDRVQRHTHPMRNGIVGIYSQYVDSSSGTYKHAPLNSASDVADVVSTSNNSGRLGNTTEVKSVGVNYIIKAKMVGVPADFMSAVDEAVEDVYGDIIPSDASASNQLVTKSDLTKYSYLTSSQSWIGEWNEFGTDWISFYSFTVPYSGKYRLHSSLIYNINNTSAINVNLRYYNTTIPTTIHLGQISSYGNSRYSINMDCIVELNANDVVQLQFQSESVQSIRWLQRDNNRGDYWQYLG